MIEQIVTFETAKLAKEKGFKELCDHRYTHQFGKSEYLKAEHGKLKPFNAVDSYGDVIGLYKRKNNENQPHIIIAPAQSLLQKWLREKYNIHIIVTPTYIVNYKNHATTKKLRFNFSLIDLKENEPLLTMKDYDNYKHNLCSFEEALEEGLQEALKLIK